MAQQETIPGTDHDVVEELELAAEALGEMVEQHKALADEIAAKREQVGATMMARGITTYRTVRCSPARVITLAETKFKVSVKLAPESDGAAAAE